MSSAHRDLEIIIMGEWVPGVQLLGLSDLPLARESPPHFDGAEARRFELYGPGWHITSYSLHLPTWPVAARWPRLVEHALRDLVRRGAVIAWLAANEACLTTPPALFDPDAMTGCVLAFRTDDGDSAQVGPLDGPIAPIGAEQMSALADRATDFIDRTVQGSPREVWQVLAASSRGATTDPANVVEQALGDDPARGRVLAHQIDRILASGLVDDALGALIEEQVPAYRCPASHSNQAWLRALREAVPPRE